MDSPKFGEALAKTMDRLDKFQERGDLDGYELGEVLVIAAFVKPMEEAADDYVEPDALESLIFVDGTSQNPWVQIGILTLAVDTAVKVPE